MGFFGELAQAAKEGWQIGLKINEINEKIEKAGTTACLTPEEREFYANNEKNTPEEHLAKYQEKQARIAENKRIAEQRRAENKRIAEQQRAENKRIAELKKQETQFFIGSLSLRRGANGLYYFGSTFVENAACWRLVSFIWDGPKYEYIAKTTGTTRPKGKLTGAILGGIAGGACGAAFGASVGTHRYTDLNTTVKRIEKATPAYLVFESVRTGERKKKRIQCNTETAGKVGQMMN